MTETLKGFDLTYLQECFELDHSSGILTWRERPRSHFRTDRGWKICNSRYPGMTVGTPSGDLGYLYVYLTHPETGAKTPIPVHHIVHFMTSGEVCSPGQVVDHKDGNPTNNRPTNLRCVSQKENLQNRGMNSNNTSGYRGVTKHRDAYLAQIRVDGVLRNLGRYSTPELAHAAYTGAARLLGFSNRHINCHKS